MDYIWEHRISFALALVVIPVAWAIQKSLLFALHRILRRQKINIDTERLNKILGTPLVAILVLIGWQSGLGPFQYGYIFERFYIFGLIWLMIRLVTLSKVIVTVKFSTGGEDNLNARKLQTQFQFLEKSARILLVIIGLALFLMTFETARRIGDSLIASAGLAGIIVGIAAQRTLSTYLAGFQVAFTQPIRMDDVVVIEGEWGQIEEITLTYVAVKLWDQRRLIVPINYFTEKPFQNWTRIDANLLGYVFLNFDYSFEVDSIREEFNRILKSTPLWDKRVSVVQVTDVSEKSIQVRFLMSARNSSQAFDLRCYVREKMLSYVQKTNPKAFPFVRVQSVNPEEDLAKSRTKVQDLEKLHQTHGFIDKDSV